MPWSGGAFTRTNGVHTGATLWAQDRDAGTKILAARHDTHDQDLATGINSTLEKSGSNAATGNLNIGSNRLTAVADGTAKTDAATVNQIQSNAPAFQASDTGTANAHVIALSPAITAYAAGQAITFKSASASTTASTLNVNGLGTKALKKKNDQAIAAGDIESGSIVTAVYDGTNFQVTSQLGSEASAGGSNTQIQYNSSGSLAGDADLTFDGTNLTVANPLYLPDGAVATPSLANTGDLNTGVYFPAADNVGVVAGGTEQFRFGSNPIPGGGKNFIINGNFSVAQRGTSFAAIADQAFSLDRWETRYSSAARVTITQDTSGVFAGLGGSLTCMKIDCTTVDSSVAAGDFFGIRQMVEAQNCTQLAYGIGAAKTVTISFNVSSPKSGAHTLVLGTADQNRSYAADYTVASADTAERISVTIPGDTAGGSFVADAGEGLRLIFSLLCGSSNSKAAGSWGAGIYEAGSNQQNLLDNTANNFYLGDVQIEIGSIATDFAHEDYGTTLRRSQRYFWRRTRSSSTDHILWPVYLKTTTVADFPVEYPVTMRAAPTFAVSAVSDFAINHQNTATATTNMTFTAPGPNSVLMAATVGSAAFTVGQAGYFYIAADGDYIQASAEL
tara:strand:+ start:5161 stop:7011 length:1851 start_codon:yes stop_codon:yes gene_type:complete